MSFGGGSGGKFQGSYNGHSPTGWSAGKDNFESSQRVQLYLQATVSEILSGAVSFEIGEYWWGQEATGGALGADKKNVEVSSAYLDWRIPKAGIKTRMGLQSLSTPAFASGNSVLNATLTAVVVNWESGNCFSTTAFWGRPFNDNYPGWDKHGDRHFHASFMDNVDAFGLLFPFSGDGWRLTPWGMHAIIGPNTLRGAVPGSGNPFGNMANAGSGTSLFAGSMFPAGGARHRDFSSAGAARHMTEYGGAWWAGISGRLDIFDPLGIGLDFEWGESNWPNDGRLRRAGWFATALVECHLDWGTPGIYAWASSGDDSNPANGSERMPALDPDNSSNYSRFAFDGARYLERNGLIANNLAGTWGAGVRLANLSLIDKLTHTARINLICGTNSPAMAKKMSLAGVWANGALLEHNRAGENYAIGLPNLYMTTLDRALEFGLGSNYEMNDNFSVNFEAGYIALWLDTGVSVWGARHSNGQSIPSVKDAWNANVSFVVSF